VLLTVTNQCPVVEWMIRVFIVLENHTFLNYDK
jgi:hypothetical protein